MLERDNLKVPYEVVALEVDKLYQKQFPPGSDKAIEDHCEYIANFIESCGWSTEEYMREYIHRGLEEYFPDTKKSN